MKCNRDMKGTALCAVVMCFVAGCSAREDPGTSPTGPATKPLYHDKARMYLNIGVHHLEKHEYNEAIRHFKKSLEENKKSREVKHVGHPPIPAGVLEKLEGIVKEIPDLGCWDCRVWLLRDSRLYTYIGKAFYDKREWEKAIPHFERSLQYLDTYHKGIDANAAESHDVLRRVANNESSLGVAYAMKDDEVKAMRHLLRARAIQMEEFGPNHQNTKTTQSWIDKLK